YATAPLWPPRRPLAFYRVARSGHSCAAVGTVRQRRPQTALALLGRWHTGLVACRGLPRKHEIAREMPLSIERLHPEAQDDEQDTEEEGIRADDPDDRES